MQDMRHMKAISPRLKGFTYYFLLLQIETIRALNLNLTTSCLFDKEAIILLQVEDKYMDLHAM